MAGPSLWACLLCASSLSLLHRPLSPPRGWNTYDSIGTASEAQVHAAISFLQHGALGNTSLTHYEYVEMDGFWFNSRTDNASHFESLDAYGRPVPGVGRFPNSNGSLALLANAAHAANLKLGIWQLFGITKGAVALNTPILGTKWRARDIALLDSPGCGWAEWEGFGVNMSHPGGQAFYDSLAVLWDSWGIDIVKLDCVFGGNYSPQRLLEIKAISRAISKVPHPIVLSLSPGGDVTESMLDEVAPFASMARMAGDLHGQWYMVPQFFQIAEKFHARVPNASHPGLFLDFDILPFGKGRAMHLSLSEMRSVMTLWCVMRSPLLFGGDITQAGDISPEIKSIVTHPDLLRMTDDVVAPRLLATSKSGRNVEAYAWGMRSLANADQRYDATLTLTLTLILTLILTLTLTLTLIGGDPLRDLG